MKRRRFLSTAAAALCGLLAGCNNSTRNTDANASNDSTTASTTVTTTAAGTTGTTAGTGTKTVGSRTFTESGKTGPQTATASVPPTEAATPTETTEIATATPTTSTAPETSNTSTPIPIPDAPGTQTETGTAKVSFENGGSRVVVSGTITGEDSCRKAVLESAQPNGGNLVVTVGTERNAGTDTMCAQVLTPVDYRFVVTPDTPPDSVTVVHTGPGGRRTITTAERGG